MNWTTVLIGVAEVAFGIGTIVSGITAGSAATLTTGGLGLSPGIIIAGSSITTGISLFALGMGEIASGVTGGKSITSEVVRTFYSAAPEATAVDIFR